MGNKQHEEILGLLKKLANETNATLELKSDIRKAIEK